MSAMSDPEKTPQRKPQARTLLTRSRILETTQKLASERQLEDITAEEIAAAAGVAKGTVFAHFGDMDGLYSYVLLDRLTALRLETDKDDMFAAACASDPLSVLASRMMKLVEVITHTPVMLRIFMENIGATKGNCAPEFVEQLDVLDRHLVTFLEKWQSSPDLSPPLRRDRDPQEMVDGLIAFMCHGAILWQSHQIEDMHTIEERLRRHAEAFLVAAPSP
ncbi:putative transcriptional regulator, TetR family [Roseibium sp. TrichSKD4]|uniref:TetR/AcrR family transcriptional regulator n=1 Tax=Roseibium sp. TrichSKD4 TaxID=744980 RepID=UPI0001E572A8|nr:TetR/AcrR family transcriptional regulator [Roseibium sp. TrichSKD4]EFO29078.1 putative transcriptional regulator, TetR family [Roseibium sp. TrichSKD4]